MDSSTSGAVNMTLARNRRRMSASSGFSSCSSVTTRGSRAIPQIGHDPGPLRRISGCIGQVYVASGVTAAGGSCVAVSGFAPVYFSGSARNFSRQRRLQKYHFVPPYS